MLFRSASYVKKSGCIFANLIAQVPQSHVVSGSCGHLYLCAAPVEHRELHQKYLKSVRILAKRLECCFYPCYIAVMIRSPDINYPVKSAFILVQMVGDVGCKISLLPIVSDHYAILFISIPAGPQPSGAVLKVQFPCLLKLADAIIPFATFEQGSLGKPVVEPDIHGFQFLPDVTKDLI